MKRQTNLFEIMKRRAKKIPQLKVAHDKYFFENKLN